MRARRHERWLEDVDAILLEAELAELHDDVLNTLLLMAETFADQEFYLHAEFVLDHFITPMEEVALQFRWFSFVGATGRSPYRIGNVVLGESNHLKRNATTEERRYHRVLVNVREFNRRYNNFQTYTLLFADSLRRLARYKMRLDKSRRSRRPRSSP